MRLMTWTVGIPVLLMCGAQEVHAQSPATWDVVVNGRSVHIDAAREWNENNWGLGFEHEFASDSRWIKVALANGFKDSMENPSYMAGGGIKRRFNLRSQGFYVDIGGVAFLMTRENVNHNQPFPGILPAATFGFRRVALNLTYLPQVVVDRVTDARRHDPSMDGVFFFQIKLDASLFGFRSRGRQFLADGSSQD